MVVARDRVGAGLLPRGQAVGLLLELEAGHVLGGREGHELGRRHVGAQDEDVGAGVQDLAEVDRVGGTTGDFALVHDEEDGEGIVRGGVVGGWWWLCDGRLTVEGRELRCVSGHC